MSMPLSLLELPRSIPALQQAASAALRRLPNEDTMDIELQARRAGEILVELQGVDERERALKLLHGLNNKLTGVLSLTALLLEDIGDEHEVAPLLRDLEARARGAANDARDVATALKAGTTEPMTD